MTAQIEVVDVAGERLVHDELWPFYRSIFGDFGDLAAWREQVWDRHTSRTGFRLALARVDERLVGFGYGYVGRPGQWWTDAAATVLHPEVASDWLGDHFELVSIGVAKHARGGGVGRRLMTALTEGLDQARWLLMTSSDPDDPARHLYRSTGWAVIGPGLSADQVIMGRAWPPS